jgi:hippurate hydrolase
MKKLACSLILILTLCVAVPASAQNKSLDAMIDQELPGLVAIYKSIHEAPELSHYEVKTSALIAGKLRAMGYDVTEHVGKYKNPMWKPYGVVAIMKNGAGPTVLVRTELDALPVVEETGLPYASKVKTKNDAGMEVGVMHACGHDLHMASLLGTAKLLADLKDRWHGTLMLIGQPAEEAVSGAQSMMEDDLYSRFPKPDYCLALHDSANMMAGKVGYAPGYALASSTSIDVYLRGLGGHGSAPELTKDPIVESAEFIMDLQTIVSREKSAFDPAVLTVGSIHGGTRYNIIPDEVHLQLTLRTYKEEVRQKIIASIRRIAQGVALSEGIPEDRAPIVTVNDAEFAPATYNDPQLTERMAGVFKQVLGADNVTEVPPIMASEDFGIFGLEGHKIPICMFSLGAVDPAKMAEHERIGKPLPGLHSSLWAPLPEPAIRTGVKSMTSAVLELMKK